MINLRYHIVSIVAVFLALGIGLALGSTFVDSVLVSNLESQVDQLQADRDAAVDRTAALEAEVAQERTAIAAFRAEAETSLGVGRFDGTPILLVAPDTLTNEELARLRGVMTRSNADFRGILEIATRLDLADSDARQQLATLFDLAGDGRGVVGRGLGFLVAQELYEPEQATVGGDSSTALSLLRDRDYIAWDPTGSTVRDLREIGHPELRVLFVGGATAPGTSEAFVALLDAAVDLRPGASVVLADGTDPLLDAVRSDSTLAAAASSVDDLDGFEGLTAAILALLQLPEVGHYGTLDGATSLLPAP